MHLSDLFDLKLAFWEGSDKPLNELKKQSEKDRVIILIGPEGGFSKQEIDQAKTHGFTAYSLGPRILRAETAAICATGLIQHLMGDM